MNIVSHTEAQEKEGTCLWSSDKCQSFFCYCISQRPRMWIYTPYVCVGGIETALL